MPHSTTTSRHTFKRPDVTYSLASPPYSSPVTTITLPATSTWTSSLHWHETHTEYLQIITGTALVTLGNITKTFTKDDGIITVPQFVKHEWRRAFVQGQKNYGQDSNDDEDFDVLIVKEWTDPVDGQKEIFFRNLNSVIEYETKDNTQPPVEWWLTWKLFVVFWACDNWPVLIDLGWVPVVGRALEWLVTHVVLLAAARIGWFIGLRGMYREFTPVRSGRVEGGGGKEEKDE